MKTTRKHIIKRMTEQGKFLQTVWFFPHKWPITGEFYPTTQELQQIVNSKHQEITFNEEIK